MSITVDAMLAPLEYPSAKDGWIEAIRHDRGANEPRQAPRRVSALPSGRIRPPPDA